MTDSFICWKCSHALAELILPMSRREECSACRADQHVCRMCIFFDGRGGCDEERAEDVSDTERANFCDYFKPSNSAYKSVDKQKSDAAKAKLAALFGDEIAEENQEDKHLSPAELAEKKLRDMLNGF